MVLESDLDDLVGVDLDPMGMYTEHPVIPVYPVMPMPYMDMERDKRCSTRKVVRSKCSTEEVEHGKFRRNCTKTEEIVRDCIGRAPCVVESKTEHTAEDVTDEVMADGSFKYFR